MINKHFNKESNILIMIDHHIFIDEWIYDAELIVNNIGYVGNMHAKLCIPPKGNACIVNQIYCKKISVLCKVHLDFGL